MLSVDPDAGVDADPDESLADVVDPAPASGFAVSCVAPEPGDELGAEVDGDADGPPGVEVEDDPDGALGAEVDGDDDGELGVVDVAPDEGELGVDVDGDVGELGVEVEGGDEVEADGDLSPGRAPV